MPLPTSPVRDHFRRMLAVYLALLVSLVPTIAVFLRARHNIRDRERIRFEELIRTTQSAVGARIDSAFTAMNGIKGFFSTTDKVGPKDWEQYLVNSGLKNRLPRMTGVGFVSRISPAEANEHVQTMRSLGISGYQLSDIDRGGDISPLTYFHSSVVTNTTALLGLNMSAQAERRKAMTQACDMGRAMATGKITGSFAAGPDHENGFEIYLPVYRTGQTPPTVDERRANLKGFVYAFFSPKLLLQEIYGRDVRPGIDFEIYDGLETKTETLLYDSDGQPALEKPSASHHLARTFPVEALGHKWVWSFTALPQFEEQPQRFLPYAALLGGLVVSAGLCGIVWTQTKARQTAEKMSSELSRSQDALRQSEERFRRLAENARDVIYRYRVFPTRGYDYLSPAIESMLGFHPSEFYADPDLILSRLHPDDLELFVPNHYDSVTGAKTVSLRWYHKDGRQVWAEMRNVPVYGEFGNLIAIEGIARDITGTRQAQDQLRAANDYLQNLLDSSLDMIVSVDENRNIIEFNRAAQNTFGYSSEEVLGRSVRMLYADDQAGRGVFTRTSDDGSFRGEVINRKKNGDSFYSFLSASILRDKNGKTLGLMGISRDVTEQKKAEESLRQSEMRLRSLVGSIDEIVFEFDEHGTYINIWTSNDRLLLRPRAELIDRRISEVMGRQLASPFLESFSRVLSSGQAESLEYAVEVGGAMRWFLARINRIPAVDGLSKTVCLFARDITERKKSEVALLESQVRLKLINGILAIKTIDAGAEEIIGASVALIRDCFPDIRAAYSVLDEQGKLAIIYCSGPAGAPDLQGQMIDLSVAPDYWAALARREAVIIDDTIGDHRFQRLSEFLTQWQRFALVDLPLKHLERAASFLSFDRSNRHHWTQHEVITLQEAVECLSSALKEAEASRNRQRAEDALAAEKERLSVTLRSIGEGVITTDTNGKILLVNKVAEILTGWRAADAIGRSLNNVFHIIHHRSKEPVENPAEKVLAGGEIFGLSNQTLLVAKDKTERIISSNAAPIYDTSGGVIGVVLVFRDITEKQKLETELLKASKIESLGLLAGGIAHDFNNILTGILGNVSLAKMMGPEWGDVHERLSHAEKACLRAKDLTQQLLTFAKGGTPIKKTALLSGLIKDSIEFALRGSSVRCQIQEPENVWPVDVDEGQISQVIQNLAINAVEAMPEGGTIKLELENVVLPLGSPLPLRTGRYVRILVQDHGTGIRSDHLARIFDPYFSTKQRGSGLGLATAYSIVKRHDGLIMVESALGVGTTFTIYLPASENPALIRPEFDGLAYPGHGRILVMDDEPLILNFAKAVLTHLGYDVELAKDGEEAVDLYTKAINAKDRFLAVIMDLTIPGGMGGKEAIRKLQAIDPNVKAIVSSGYSNDPVMSEFQEYGFAGVVSKPYKIEELSRVLHQLLLTESSQA